MSLLIVREKCQQQLQLKNSYPTSKQTNVHTHITQTCMYKHAQEKRFIFDVTDTPLEKTGIKIM